ADARAGLAELGVARSHRQVAKQMDFIAAADAIAAHLGDDRLVDHAHRGRQRYQAPHVRTTDLRIALALVADIAARAEGLVAGTGQHDDTDLRIVGRNRKRAGEFLVSLRTHRVTNVRTVDDDVRDTALRRVRDVFELTHPISTRYCGRS